MTESVMPKKKSQCADRRYPGPVFLLRREFWLAVQEPRWRVRKRPTPRIGCGKPTEGPTTGNSEKHISRSSPNPLAHIRFAKNGLYHPVLCLWSNDLPLYNTTATAAKTYIVPSGGPFKPTDHKNPPAESLPSPNHFPPSLIIQVRTAAQRIASHPSAHRATRSLACRPTDNFATLVDMPARPPPRPTLPR